MLRSSMDLTYIVPQPPPPPPPETAPPPHPPPTYKHYTFQHTHTPPAPTLTHLTHLLPVTQPYHPSVIADTLPPGLPPSHSLLLAIPSNHSLPLTILHCHSTERAYPLPYPPPSATHSLPPSAHPPTAAVTHTRSLPTHAHTISWYSGTQTFLPYYHINPRRPGGKRACAGATRQGITVRSR